MPTGQKLDKLYKLHSRVYGLEASKTAGAKPKANAKPVATITKARGLRRSSRISGTATRPRGHLQNLPTEIIVHILEYLSAQDIALFRTVCCAFRDIVNESVALQYTIERSLAGVVEGSLSANDNLKDRLAAVREWRQAWRTLRWTDRRHAREVPEFGMSQVSGSVYTIIASSSASPDGAALEFRRLGSKLRGVPPKEWSLDELPDHESFAVEYEEDLLVLAEIYEGTKRVDLRFLSCTTGELHSAASAVVTISTHKPVTDMNGFWIFNTFACGDLVGLAVYCDSMPGLHSEIWIVNWKRAEVVMNVYAKNGSHSVEPLDFKFFDDRHIVVTTTGSNTDAVVLVDCYRVGKTRILLLDAIKHAPVILGLPKLAKKVAYSFNAVSCQPRRPPERKRRDPARFHAAGDMPLTLVTICLSDSRRGERRFDLIIPAAIWLSRLQSADTTGVLVPWEQWGEESRMLDSTEASCSQVFGTRYLTSEPYMSRESRYGVRSRTDLLCVYDFAPVPVLMHDLLTVGEDADVCVLTFLCSDKSVWAKPVRTAAPFKRIEVPGLVVGDSDSVYMGEDGLFVRSADYILEDCTLQAFSI